MVDLSMHWYVHGACLAFFDNRYDGLASALEYHGDDQ